jgi:putative inorganic carbon (HCO3(-)) transporter
VVVPLRYSGLIAPGMALGLALFYLAPLPLAVRLSGLLLFGALALLRPGLALAFVPLTAPLYLIPAALLGLRSSETLLPLHEVALLVTTAAAAGRLLWALIRREELPLALPDLRRDRARFAPLLLFLLAGIWGAAIALPQARGEALRELRWLIIEPLIFVGLLATLRPSPLRPAVLALVIAGASVALLGVLQALGLDLVPLIGEKRSFSENIVEAGSVRRVASVYGHPNNLGLFLERIWPLAAVLGLMGLQRPTTGDRQPENKGTKEQKNKAQTTEPRTKNQEPPINDHKEDTAIHQPSATSYQPTPGHRPSSIVHRPILLPLATLLALAGLAVSFSRGAWLGAAVAGAVLVAPRLRGRLAIALPILAAAGAVLVLAAVGYIARHPLGIGLDQFYTYHRPDSGLSLIDPALVGTSEEYAAHPHNLLLDIWLRMGPPGLAAFGWLIARMIRRARRSNSLLALGALAALAAALTHGLVDQFYFVPDLAITFWVLYGVVDDVPIAPTQL